MRRSLALILLGASVLAAGACSSSNDASTTGTTVAAGPTTTAKAATTVSADKCKAVATFQQATVVANKPESQAAENKDKVTKTLDSTAAALKKAFPAKVAPDTALRTETDAQLTYLKKLVASQNPTDAEKQASVKARDAMTLFHTNNCKPAAGTAPTTTPKSSTTKKPGTSTTTATPADSTTTAKPATTTTAP